MSNLPHNESTDAFLHQMGDLLRASVVGTAQTGERQNLAQQSGERQKMIGFGEYLAAARTQQHFSQSAFARLLGTTEAYICALEQGLLPRKALDDPLLARIATVLDDEREILTIILGDATAVAPTAVAPTVAVVNEFSPCSDERYKGESWRLLRLLRESHNHTLQRIVRKWQGLYWGTVTLLSPLLLWTSLQVDRYRNLLDRLQPSRLTIGQLAPKRIIVMVTVCCFIALWIGITGNSEVKILTSSIATNQLSTAIAPSTGTTVEQHSLSNPPTVALGGSIVVNHSDVTATAMLPLSITQSIHGQQGQHPVNAEETLALYRNKQLMPTLEQSSYRIVYTGRNASKQYSAPYIVVNEEQVALIQFQIPKKVPGSQHCINSGRFDLCPI